jgi:hypothetical protein
LRDVSGNDGIFAVFHGTGVEVTEDMDIGDDTQVYERTATGYDPKLLARGWMSRLFRLR